MHCSEHTMPQPYCFTRSNPAYKPIAGEQALFEAVARAGLRLYICSSARWQRQPAIFIKTRGAAPQTLARFRSCEMAINYVTGRPFHEDL
jgi:hypothetical protein